jgi:two-component system, cell cycle sensor histidine kinase and response regulator CckA
MMTETTRTRPGSLDPAALKALLVVDDDQQLASALQWILRDENYLVDVAFDGEEALLKVRVHEYDAVICDLMMPRLRGDKFYVQARKLRPNLAKRFIFITGFATDLNIREFLSARRLKHLIKPFPIPELIDCVKKLLAQKPASSFR